MKRFLAQDFINNSNRPEVQRRYDKGFVKIESELVERATTLKNESQPFTLVELGIGGAGSHRYWDYHLNNSKVYGVDIFCPNKSNEDKLKNTNYSFMYREEFFEWKKEDSLNTTKVLENAKNVQLFWGVDGYTKQGADIVFKDNNYQRVDVVVDDASPDGQGLHNLKNAWKHAITDTGIIISETLTGNGTSVVYNKGMKWHIDQLKEHAAPQGYVCINTTRFYNTVDPKTEYMMPFLCVYAHDFNLYKDILLKYEGSIVAGHENL